MYELREWQRKAYSLIVDQSGIVVAATGSGKTSVGLKLIADNPDAKILVVVPTVVLQQQWYDEIEKHVGVSSYRIGGGYKDYPGIGVTIAVINSLQKINLSSSGAKFDHAIFDEVHRYASENSLIVIRDLQCPHKIGLTATLERSDGDHEYLLSFIGPVVYEMDLSSPEAKEYVSDFAIDTVGLELDKYERLLYDEENTLFLEALKKYGYDITKIFKGRDKIALKSMQMRKNIIQDSPTKREQVIAQVENYEGSKILIFDEKQENAKLIYKDLLSEGYKVGLYHSGLSKKELKQTMTDYKSGALDILVTVRALDEGMDVPSINVAIIVNGNSTKRQFYQRLGRAIRKEKGKIAKLIMLYFKKTHEVNIINKRLRYLK